MDVGLGVTDAGAEPRLQDRRVALLALNESRTGLRRQRAIFAAGPPSADTVLSGMV